MAATHCVNLFLLAAKDHITRRLQTEIPEDDVTRADVDTIILAISVDDAKVENSISDSGVSRDDRSPLRKRIILLGRGDRPDLGESRVILSLSSLHGVSQGDKGHEDRQDGYSDNKLHQRHAVWKPPGPDRRGILMRCIKIFKRHQ